MLPFLANLVRNDLDALLFLERFSMQAVSQAFTDQQRDGSTNKQHRYHLFYVLLLLVHQPGQAQQSLQIVEDFFNLHMAQMDLPTVLRSRVHHEPEQFG